MASLSSSDEISHSIRQEIVRFESVHPSIYAIYDLVDAVDDKNLSDSLRQLVVSIEDAFVNSQEWTLSHNVPDLKLGLLGSIHSGKSALVHRYLTGTYLHEESPEGGRFKKEVSLDNQSHLLLIRDEGGPPDQQFSHWIDGVIFVFSLEDYESYQVVYDYYSRLNAFRNTSTVPILLVGTQDSHCESYARVVDDARARKLASDLRRCVYYETCAAYGLNVERVFQDACLKILLTKSSNQSQYQKSNTPFCSTANTSRSNTAALVLPCSTTSIQSVCPDKSSRTIQSVLPSTTNVRRPDMLNNPGFEPDAMEECKTEANESITPNSTPTHSRQNRRKSNLFKKTDDEKDRDKKINGIGSGRAIPLMQGFLFKRTFKPLKRDWKTKKYVTLTDDARLTYHPTIQDYMENTHGKEIDLSRITVKIPGVPFRQVGGRITSNGLLRSQLTDPTSEKQTQIQKNTESPNDALNLPDSITPRSDANKDPASVKKRHRRVKSNPKSSATDGYDSEGYEFQLISMDRQWHFEAKSFNEREEWLSCIEAAIMTRLQLNESNKRNRAMNASVPTGMGSNSSVSANRSTGDRSSLASGRSVAGDSSESTSIEPIVQSIRSVPGNEYCADCGALDPDWASLNLGAMVCIGCSGIHRQLGTHISRIRSLHLDEWSSESVAVMCSIGNTLANSVWEAAVPVNAGNRRKPEPSSSRDEKESWIRAKYDRQEFLPPLPYPDAPLQQQLIDAIARQDTRQVILCLALATPETVNAPYSRQDPRAAIHIAATLGNLVYLQLLLWYNGDPTVADHEGRNAYYYAHCSQKFDCAEFLRRNGCQKQLIPPNSSAVTLSGRTGQSGTSLLQVSPVNHSQIIPPGPYPTNPIADPHAPFGATLLLPSTVSQPYHFSHLQQQLPSSQPPHPTGHLISSCQPFVTHLSPANSVISPGQPYVIGSTSNIGSSTHPNMLQSSSSVCASIPSTVVIGSTVGAVACRPAVSGQQFPLVPSAFIGNVSQALGATLPRRRAPPPVTSTIAQPFPSHMLMPSGTHRPYSGAGIDRAPLGMVRSSVSNFASQISSHIASSYGRPISSSTVTTSSSGLIQHTGGNPEVGL